jgi:hypothetical protein
MDELDQDDERQTLEKEKEEIIVEQLRQIDYHKTEGIILKS